MCRFSICPFFTLFIDMQKCTSENIIALLKFATVGVLYVWYVTFGICWHSKACFFVFFSCFLALIQFAHLVKSISRNCSVWDRLFVRVRFTGNSFKHWWRSWLGRQPSQCVVNAHLKTTAAHLLLTQVILAVIIILIILKNPTPWSGKVALTNLLLWPTGGGRHSGRDGDD